MGFDKWSFRDIFVMIWALSIASIAIIFVCVSLGNLIFENSSNIASWLQAIGGLIMVGITVALYYLGEKRRDEERSEEKQLEVDEAKFYFLNHAGLFMSVPTYGITNQINYFKNVGSGRRGNISNYPAVFLFNQIYPQIERLQSELQEFMCMQVPLGIPRMCITHVDKHKRIINEIFSLAALSKFHLDKLEGLSDIRKPFTDEYMVFHLEQAEDHLKHYVPRLQLLTKEFEEVNESLLAFMRS